MTPTFAAEEPVPAEEVSTSVEETAAPEETAVEAETNVDYLNYLELEDFIISAERIPTNKWDTPANVTVITAQDIEDNHYQSISEALNHVNGVIDSTSYVQMNGGNRVLVLVDGRRWFDPQISRQEDKAFTGFPSMKMIERIEVLKGGNSALYGSDAFSGVINIVTKKGTKNETTIDLNTGSWRRHQYEIANQGTAGKFGWFVTGRLTKSHPWDFKKGLTTDDSSRQQPQESSDHALSIRLDQRFTDRNSLTFDFMHISERSREKYTDTPNLYDPSKYLINNLSLTYNFKEGTSTPGWLRYFNNYYTHTDLGTRNPHTRLQGIEYQNGWELGQHKIIAGLEWHKSKAVYPLHGYEDVDMNTKSFYLQDTISLGDKWTVIPGVRLDHSSEFGNNWSPKIAANYRPDETTKFYASWGRSYNLPLINELYSDRPENSEDARARWQSDMMYYGNRSLRPEKGTSLNIGIEHDFDEKTGAALHFFYNKLDDPIGWDTYYYPGNYLSWGWADSYNSYPLKSRGLELTFHQKIDDHFSYNLGYSHTHTHMENPTGNLPYYRPQPNSYRIGLNYQNRGLKMNLLGTMASSINTNANSVWKSSSIYQSYPKRRYAVLDFNLSYTTKDNLTFYFKALNLTNQHYSNEESYYYTRWWSENDDKYIYPAAGRSFIYGMNYTF